MKITSFKKLYSSPTHRDKLSVLFLTSFVLSFLVAAKYSVFSSFSPDSWLHLGIGKHVIEQKNIPSHFEVSFKEDISLSLEWISHSWLSDSLFYIAGSINSSFAGIFILLPLLLINMFLLYEILILLKIPRKNILLFLPIPILLSVSFLKIHPFAIALPLLLLIFFVYIRWKNGHSKAIFFLPLIVIFFANTAGGIFFIPIVFIFFLLITELFAFFFKKYLPHQTVTIRNGFFFVLSFILCIPSILVNPTSARLLIYPLTFFGILERKSWFSSLSGSLLINNQNFLRNSPSTLIESLYLLYFLICLGLLFFTLIKQRFFFSKYYYVLPLALFFILPIIWIRFIPLTVFLTFPLFMCLISVLFNLKRFVQFTFGTIIILVSLYLLIKPVEKSYTVPSRHLEIIKELNLPLNLYTSQDITGFALYTLFPAKMGIDAQDDVFDENELITTFSPAISTLPQDPQVIDSILEKNNIGTILVNKNLGDMAYLFNQINEWALIYFDDNGFLFSKKEFLDESLLLEHEIKYLDLGRNLGFDPKAATESAKELERFSKKYPESYLALGQLASIYRFQGKLNEAENALTRIPEDKWTYITMTEMARIKAAQGDCKTSEKWFLEALKDRSEKNFSRAVLDLAVLYAGCLNEPEKARHYLSRYHSFQLSPLEREKVRQISDEFNIPLEE